MIKLLATLTLAIAATGCATAEYDAYVKGQEAVATAQAKAEVARYQALALIATTGDEAAKVAAVMSIQSNGQQRQTTQVQMPVSAWEQARAWASILVPGLTQGYVAKQNANVQIVNSNNAAATSASTNAAFVGIASKIQAPGTTYNNSYNQDSTHVPTVVLAPAPEVVQIPTQVITTTAP